MKTLVSYGEAVWKTFGLIWTRFEKGQKPYNPESDGIKKKKVPIQGAFLNKKFEKRSFGKLAHSKSEGEWVELNN